MDEQIIGTALTIFQKFLSNQEKSGNELTPNSKTPEDFDFSSLIESTGMAGKEIIDLMLNVYQRSIDSVGSEEKDIVTNYFDIFVDRNLPQEVSTSIKIEIIKWRSNAEVAKIQGISNLVAGIGTALTLAAGAIGTVVAYNKTKPKKWWEL